MKGEENVKFNWLLNLYFNFIIYSYNNAIIKNIENKKYKQNSHNYKILKANLIEMKKCYTKYGYMYRGLYCFIDEMGVEHKFYDIYLKNIDAVKDVINIYCSYENSEEFYTEEFLKSEKSHIFILVLGIIIFLLIFFIFQIICI